MKAKSIFSIQWIFILLGSCLSIACNVGEEPPTNELIKYNLPTEVSTEIFTQKVLQITGSLEPFLDRIQDHQMKIYDGENPPEIYREEYIREGIPPIKVPKQFQVRNNCIFDETFPSYADSTFGDYLDSLLIVKEDENFISYNSYKTYSDERQPEFENGFDTGSGFGYVSGESSNFTIFYKVNNGVFGNIPYQAIWIISGEVISDDNFYTELRSISKCLILTQKGNDPNNEMANVGTIRIFRDDGPIQEF